MSPARPVSRRRLLSLATAASAVLGSGTLAAGTAAAETSSPAEPVDAFNRSARPLSDLSALGRMVGGAHVVGLGEASHSAHEFFTLKQRVFRHLVATKGFTTFALEASWSTGLRLDAYVTHGIGDPVQIMRDEFQGQYVFWNTPEYLDLIRWMRRYNITHPGRPQLRFVGNDLGYAGPDAFRNVTDYLAAYRPGLVARIGGLYAGLKPAAGTPAGPWMARQLTKELPARRTEADQADTALALLRDHGRPGATRDAQRAHAWAVQNATAIAQSFTAYAFPDEQFPERMRYRDRAMAANTAWWLRREGGRILLASNNGHVAYTSDNPDEFPEPTGAFLRAQLGPDYVNIGLTFNQGTVNALPDFTAQQPQTYTVTPAPEGHNEYTLDKVRYRDFSIDLRTAPAAARAWLAAARPTRSYGLYWSTDDPATALGRSYDILIHLHLVEAAHILQ